MPENLFIAIQKSTALRASRQEIADDIVEHPHKLDYLMAIVVDPSSAANHKACWIADLYFENEIDAVKAYIGAIVRKLHIYDHDGAKRSISRILLTAAQIHFDPKDSRQFYEKLHLTKITEVFLNWLITDEKVATKVNALRTLYEIGRRERWIHAEIKQIIEKDYAAQSAGYKVAARDIMRKI